MGCPSWLKIPPIPTPEASHVTWKTFEKVRKGKDWGLGHSLLELMKCLGSSFGLGKVSFLEAICDGGSDGTEASYEPSVEDDKSMEALNFLKIFGFWPLQNGLDLFWVHGYSLGRDNIA